MADGSSIGHMGNVSSEKVGTATRPVSVVWYERFAVAAVAATLASGAANRATLAKY